MTPIEEFKVRMDRLIAKNESLFAAAVKDFRAQYVEALETTVTKQFHVGPIGPGEVTGPVYVNHIPYVPVSELDRMRAALQFYADPANWIDAEWDDGCNTPNAIPAVNQEGAWVCDCGDIARAALGQEPTT